MRSQLLAVLGLLSVLASLVSAQAPSGPEEKSTRRSPRVEEALVAARQDLPRAIALVEKALESAPDDRDLIYLLGAMTFVRGDRSDDPSERIVLFRKSSAAFARLQRSFKDLTSYEKAFLARSRFAHACVLAAGGKTQEALGIIKQLLDAGFGDLDSFDDAPELAPVRELSGYRLAIEGALRPNVVEEMASFHSFPFDFELKDLDGKVVRLADYRGKVMIVDLWGTWCPPCRAEMPHFVELYNEYRRDGLEIVGINCNETGSPDQVKKTIEDFASALKVSYKCVVNDEKTEDRIPGFQGYPTTLFLDRSGQVRMLTFGYTPRAKLEVIVKILLAEGSTSDERQK